MVTVGLGTDEVSAVNSTVSRQDSESSDVFPEPDTDDQQSVKCSLLHPLPPLPKLSEAIHYKGLSCLARRTALGTRSGEMTERLLDSNPAESSTRTRTLSRPPAQHTAVQHNNGLAKGWLSATRATHAIYTRSYMQSIYSRLCGPQECDTPVCHTSSPTIALLCRVRPPLPKFPRTSLLVQAFPQ